MAAPSPLQPFPCFSLDDVSMTRKNKKKSNKRILSLYLHHRQYCRAQIIIIQPPSFGCRGPILPSPGPKKAAKSQFCFSLAEFNKGLRSGLIPTIIQFLVGWNVLGIYELCNVNHCIVGYRGELKFWGERKICISMVNERYISLAVE